MSTMTAFTVEEALARLDIPRSERSPLVVEVEREDYVRVVAQQFGLPLNEQGSRISCRRWIPVLNEYLTYVYEREAAA